jgi:hypothetical protein
MIMSLRALFSIRKNKSRIFAGRGLADMDAATQNPVFQVHIDVTSRTVYSVLLFFIYVDAGLSRGANTSATMDQVFEF